MDNFESELLLICKDYEQHLFMPNNLREKYELFLQAEHNKYVMKSVAGVGLSLGLLYFIAPLFSRSGLRGIAAHNNGLANLGGGALSASGYGMAGGTAVVASAGYGLARWFAYKSDNQLFAEFLNTQPRIFQDSITVDNYKIFADFKFENGKFIFLKNIRVYKNNNIVFDGYISRNNGNLILEKNN